MNLSILQLNINADNYWSKLIPFLTSHHFDIINLQEVCGKDSFCGNIHCVRDCYEELKQTLSNDYKSELAIAQRYTSSPTSYLANATFYKKNLQLLDKKIVFLYKRTSPFPEDAEDFQDVGRNFLHLTLTKEDKTFSVINTHLAWAKTTKEEPHQTQQGEIFLKFLQNITPPFVLSGDFNLDPMQPLIQKINSFTRNLIAENKIINTLNEKFHRAKVLFPPGASVDYIFTSPDIKVKKFSVIEENLSDHLGLTTEIEI